MPVMVDPETQFRKRVPEGATARVDHLRGEGWEIEPAAVPAGVEATDAALEHATVAGVDLTTIKGTGKGGRITAADVDAAKEA